MALGFLKKSLAALIVSTISISSALPRTPLDDFDCFCYRLSSRSVFTKILRIFCAREYISLLLASDPDPGQHRPVIDRAVFQGICTSWLHSSIGCEMLYGKKIVLCTIWVGPYICASHQLVIYPRSPSALLALRVAEDSKLRQSAIAVASTAIASWLVDVQVPLLD